MTDRPPHLVRDALTRSLRLRCPRCGKGRILKDFFSQLPACPVCGLVYVPDPVDHGMFMYFSTAAITGLFLFCYFLIGFPTGAWARVGVGAMGLGLMIVTAPLRRCLGVGVIYAADAVFGR